VADRYSRTLTGSAEEFRLRRPELHHDAAAVERVGAEVAGTAAPLENGEAVAVVQR
jgi:hypothetical protein